MADDTQEQLPTCPVCTTEQEKLEEGGPEFDDVGRKMWDTPDVRYFKCGRVHTEYEGDGEQFESAACDVIRDLRAENEQLRVELLRTRADLGNVCDKRDDLAAENEWLRKVIADNLPDFGDYDA